MKTWLKMRLALGGFFLLSMLFIPSASMALTTVTFTGSSDDFGLGPLNFGTVSIDYIGNNTVHFVVDVNQSFLGSGAGIEKFGFNSSIELDVSDFSGLPVGWVPYFDRSFGMFGLFSNDPFGGPRVDPLEFYVRDAALVSEDQVRVSNEEGFVFVANVSGFSYQAQTPSGNYRTITSAKVAAVPESGVPFLLGAGLTGVGLLKRRRARS